ncbi:phage tail tip fiber protein [Aeromonas salmonicida]|uniref:phage tail tip fiber protein n=1 Tax=Aeromonas salmonicida TaxID=645 RepID=UPI003D320F6B
MATVTVAGVLAAISAASAVVSLAMVISMKPGSMNGPSDTGSNVQRKGKDDPKLVAFGRCLVPASRVWQNVQDTNTKWLTQAYSFGVGPILKYEQLYIDSVPVYEQGSNRTHDVWYGVYTKAIGNNGYQKVVGTNISPEFPNLGWGLRSGKTTEQTWTQLIEKSDGEWTANHRGDRTASASLLIERWINKGGDNNIRLISPNFKFEALVHGNGVIDPRYITDISGAVKDVNKRIWNVGAVECYRNPASVIYTYLIDTYYGVGLPIDSVDKASFVALANYCDANKFYFDGYIDQSQDFAKSLIEMISAADGTLYFEDGVIKAKADKASPVVASITESDIVGSFTLSNANSGDYHNAVKLEFINATTVFNKDQYMIPKDRNASAKIKEDGYVKEKTFKYPYTIDSEDNKFKTVKILANKRLRKAAFQKSVQFDIDNTKVTLRVLDVFEITMPDYALEKAKFRVEKITTSLDDKILVSKIVATEYNDAVYDELNYTDDGITSPATSIPSVKILSPVDLQFIQQGYTKSGSGLLFWSSRYQREHTSVIEFKLSSQGDESWTRYETKEDSYQLYGLRAGLYDFRVMTRSYLGNTSEWALIQKIEIKAGVILPKVTGLKADFSSRDCIVTWNDMSKTALTGIPQLPVYDGVSNVGDVLAYYEIAIYKGAGRQYVETLTTSTPRLVYTYSQNALDRLSRDLRFDVRIVSTDNSQSLPVSVTAHNDQVAQPSGVVVNGELTNLLINWDSPEDEDYSVTEIHIGPDLNFAPTASTLKGTSKTGFIQILWPDDNKFWFAKLGHYDVFGKDGMSYSKAIAFEMKGLDELLTKTESFDSLSKDVDQARTDIDAARKDIDASKAEIIKNATDIKTTNDVVKVQGAAIETNKQAIASTDGNLATLSTSVDTRFKDANAKITASQTAIADDKKALADYKLVVSAEFNKTNANVTQNTTSIADDEKALADYKIEVKAALDKTNANVTTNTTAIADDKKALADYKLVVKADFDGVKASVTENSTAIAGVDGKVKAMHQIKLDVNGKVSGLIMGNTGTESTFDVIADRFRVANATDTQAVFEINNGRTLIRNALVDNLTSANIVAGGITGVSINSSTQIRAGSGNTSATLDGADGTWRIYAGNASGASAPFRVNTAGKLFATNAEITGVVNATSGSFTGAINAQSGSITGRLTVGNSYIDGRAGQNFLVGANNRFIVDADGNMNCQYATIEGGRFNGTVYANNIVGDTYRKGFFSLPEIPPVILSGGSGEQEFFRVNVGNQPFNQRVVINRIPGAFIMYDNPGKCDIFYQIEGQGAVWFDNVDGPSNTKQSDTLNFTALIPAGSTWIRFFFVPYNKVTKRRTASSDGIIEIMKYEQVGWSVTGG